jgi:hypothetical protein
MRYAESFGFIRPRRRLSVPRGLSGLRAKQLTEWRSVACRYGWKVAAGLDKRLNGTAAAVSREGREDREEGAKGHSTSERHAYRTKFDTNGENASK